MNKISWKNTVTVRISKKNFENFANECKNENILLNDIVPEEDCFNCDMSFSDYKRIRGIASKSGTKIKIIKKRGAGYFVKKHKRRYGFYAGAFLALSLFAYLTSCIWVVEVVGNDKTATERILEVVEKNGIGIGSFRFGKDLADIKNKSLIELDTLSWLWVSLDGTRAVVEVREKGDSRDIIDKTKPCNLVASHPGVIVDMEVKSGRKIVERGATVSKGQLLVSGAVETFTGNRYIYSSGTVTARTWRTMSGEYHHTQTNRIKTDETEKKISLEVFGKKVKLYKDPLPSFENYDVSVKEKRLRIFKNIYLPLSFTTEEFCEIITEEEILPDSVVVSEAVEYLTGQIEAERSTGAITENRSYTCEVVPGGNLYVTVTLESLEDISFPVEIEVQSTEEYTLGENY